MIIIVEVYPLNYQHNEYKCEQIPSIIIIIIINIESKKASVISIAQMRTHTHTHKPPKKIPQIILTLIFNTKKFLFSHSVYTHSGSNLV